MADPLSLIFCALAVGQLTDLEADCRRFPPPDVGRVCRHFNWEYRQHCERCKAVSPHPEEWAEAIRQAEWCYRCFDLLDDMKCPHRCLESRLEARDRLIEHIGTKNFFLGRLPPPVPLRYFVEIR